MEEQQRQFESSLQKFAQQAGEGLEVKNTALQALGTLQKAYPNDVSEEDVLALASDIIYKLKEAPPHADLNTLRNIVVAVSHEYFSTYRYDTTNAKAIKDAKGMDEYFERVFDTYLADSA